MKKLIFCATLCCLVVGRSFGQNTNFGTGAGNAGTNSSAFGFRALDVNVGSSNSAFGFYSLRDNILGEQNSAFGVNSLKYNLEGSFNTAVGGASLFRNSTGNGNSAVGYNAMFKNETGTGNVAIGIDALKETAGSNSNTAVGAYSLYLQSNNSSYGNTAVGWGSMYAQLNGSVNTAVGNSSGPAINGLTNTSALGYQARPTISNSVRIGNAFVTSISGIVDFTQVSDGRFKDDLKEDVAGLDFILKLRPVSYNLNRNKLDDFLNPKKSDVFSDIAPDESTVNVERTTGFIAQEVEAIVKESGYVFSGVDKANSENDIYGLRYASFVVPLVSAVQELNEQAQTQNKTIDELKAIVNEQQQQIDRLLGAAEGEQKSTEQTSTGAANALYQIYPNPFSTIAIIEMEISSAVIDARIIISNLEGKEINSFTVSERGKTTLELSGSAFESGTYLYTLIADGSIVDSKRMVLTK